MMKLRTKSANLSLSDEQMPSTSSASSSTPTFVHSGGLRRLSTNSNTATDHHHHSPDSPVIGRIAKSNARILNGLDLNDVKRSGMCVDMFGILPELKVDELNADKYPNICKHFVPSGGQKNSLDVDNLQSMQHELEELISLNVDCQKTIHGEITYMTSGDYPTIDLSKRPMPKYEMHQRKPAELLLHREEHRMGSNENSSDKGSFTNFLMELGLLSSHDDDDEEEEPPGILDVPNRFWTWAKEYLGPISKATLREFKHKLFDRFVADNGHYFTSRFGVAAATTATKTATTTNITKTTTTTPKTMMTPSPKAVFAIQEAGQKRGRHHHRPPPFCSSSSSSTEHSPAKKLLKLDKSPLSSSSSSLTSTELAATKSGGGSGTIKQQQVAAVANGMMIISSSNATTTTTKNGIIMLDNDNNNKKKTKIVVTTSPLPPPSSSSATAKDVEEQKDEVLAELQKKEQQLKALYEQTKPVVEQLYDRLKMEYAVHEVFKRLDSADNSLLQLGSKYKRLAFFSTEQRTEVDQVLSMHSKVYKQFSSRRK